MREQRLALLWHLAEFLVALSIIGLVWSIKHQRPRMVLTSPVVAR